MTSAGFKKIVFSLLFIFLVSGVQAQFLKASVGINGLTCSQCSRSVEMQLRKLSFVQDVKMDLEQTEGTIVFRKGKKVNINAIAKAVKDAGFSVRFVKAEIDQSSVHLTGQGCFVLNGDAYTLLGRQLPASKANYMLTFIGKDYQPGNELKRYTLPKSSLCKGKVNYFTTTE